MVSNYAYWNLKSLYILRNSSQPHDRRLIPNEVICLSHDSRYTLTHVRSLHRLVLPILISFRLILVSFQYMTNCCNNLAYLFLLVLVVSTGVKGFDLDFLERLLPPGILKFEVRSITSPRLRT